MLVTAAVLVFLTGVAHSYLGERYILVRLFRRDNLPKLFGGTAFTIGTLRFAWHITTVAWFGLGAMLVLAARGALTADLVLEVIAWTAIGSAALPVIFTRGRHLSWMVFLAVAGLIFAAS
jgi:hypothetical protein